MKNLVIILLLVSAVSCSKQVLEKSSKTDSLLKGKWKWVEATGGFAGRTLNPQTEGYTMALKFKGDSVYFYRNDTLKNADTFSIKKDRTIFSVDSVYVINYGSGGMDQVIMQSKNDTLALADNANDGYNWLYVKDK